MVIESVFIPRPQSVVLSELRVTVSVVASAATAATTSIVVTVGSARINDIVAIRLDVESILMKNTH